MKKLKWKLVAVLLLSIFVYISFNVISICTYSKVYSDKECDVAIVLGAACSNLKVSEVYKQRLNQSVKLFEDGKVKYIITTGGKGKGNTVADATVAKDYLVKCGIPEDVILEEKDSTITQENLENAKDIMDEGNLKTALIVSDPLHMKRAMLLTKDAGIDGYSSPTKTSAYKSLSTKAPFVARETFFYVGYKWYRLFK
ncbi:YdcF family protein [uncultured Eubacterium sp.]|uniref:YdcF family protein n=1 Tax=uncultured Eubacterium sp. TaxID=165185 RepID=UPI00259A2D51|nr:YdcF family protein [uncultured Eubacterium sp.]